MKISYNWLKNYIDIDIDHIETAKILTDIGLEVEGIETFEELKGNLKGFVVGLVKTCEKHPNADKLSVTIVDIGAENLLNIVCGAPNVAPGQKVIVATIGAEIHTNQGSFTIKKSKIRGEVSEGMICAEDEIGMGTSHDGIMVLPNDTTIGQQAAEYFGLKQDIVFEIGLTPNRVDAASHFGVARDLCAYFAIHEPKNLIKPSTEKFKTDNTANSIHVELIDSDACKRYCGLTISGVKVTESPKWLQLYLKAIGLAPINNIVDITNYVLHELGQPLHAFDADKLKGNTIKVQKLPQGTKFVTLDEVERELHHDDLMICDAENPVCIGGVFGGIHSGVSNKTTTVFLESAYFDPVHVRKTAKRHGLNTDASFRFERGIDPDITIDALKRAAMLIKELAGGEITSEITDIYPEPIADFEVKVKYTNIERLIGKVIHKDTIEKILTSLGIEYISDNCEEMHLRVPPFKVDVTREADIIEEILRIYGYNNIDFSQKLVTSIEPTEKPNHEKLVNKVSDHLASAGYTEIMSNSLTKKAYYEKLDSLPANRCVEILNPLSNDLNVMRQTIIFSGLEAIKLNINHKNANLKLFEYGRCYKLKGEQKTEVSAYHEDRRITMFLTGKRNISNWALEEKKVSFFQLKADAEVLLHKLGMGLEQFKVGPLEHINDIFTGGLEYSNKKTVIARIGEISNQLLRQFDIEQNVFVCEFYWDEIFKRLKTTNSFSELPKQLEVRRDLALLIDENVKFENIQKLAFECDQTILKKVGLFDYYKGKGIPAGKKSYGVYFTLLDEEKTLTDKVIDKTMKKIIDKYTTQLNAELR